ncbi:helix-turn-helix domain-containing protein [Kiritimatiellaeota bacterium B1221]|nr:helix-turn-helix domain-containing protein [Kiritimatiellaeota bacterium B1221]
MNEQAKTPGEILKAAREELGKSHSDMAEITRISIQQIKGLEEDRYESIPAPMYVRGFMKLYAQKLGLNHEPLVDKYERIRKGESLVPVVERPAPQNGAEAVAPVFEEPEHPEISREVPLHPQKTKSRPSFDFQAWLDRLPALPELPALPDMDWVRNPKVLYTAVGVVVLIAFSLSVKNCGGGSSDAEGDTPVEPSELKVNQPLISPPEPVYFELPNTYQ